MYELNDQKKKRVQCEDNNIKAQINRTHSTPLGLNFILIQPKTTSTTSCKVANENKQNAKDKQENKPTLGPM
jgi:hypothetical protein